VKSHLEFVVNTREHGSEPRIGGLPSCKSMRRMKPTGSEASADIAGYQSIYPHILVPIDGSETSACVLDEAIKLAKSLNSRLRLLHVVNEHVLDVTAGGGTYAGGLIKFLREQGEKIVRDAMALVRRQGVDAETVVLESLGGPAADSIVEQAKQWPAQLIVMGTHGRHGLRRLALGSDSESVVRDAPVPVLLVRRAENRMGVCTGGGQ
jgi:nucleotide-binding universal stress UspA family protein